jgi:hypothetical protein
MSWGSPLSSRSRAWDGRSLRPSVGAVLQLGQVLGGVGAFGDELGAQPFKASTLHVAELGIIRGVLPGVGCGGGLHGLLSSLLAELRPRPSP